MALLEVAATCGVTRVEPGVPSARTILAEISSLSLLAWVPQFMPEALFMTMPPTIADLTEAGSGANLRP